MKSDKPGYEQYDHSILRDMDGFEKHEFVAEYGYWKDPDWKKVEELRKEGKIPESNHLVFTIRNRWGVD